MNVYRLIDGEALRGAMRLVPSPVTVVTARSGEAIRGITIGSFTSVSLEPPLISFNVGRASRMHDLITRADGYAVHVLGESQVGLSEHFARPDLTPEEQFAGVPCEEGPGRLPLIREVPVILLCRPYAVYPAGDHSILVGEVTQIRVDPAAERSLLYYRQGYFGVGAVLEADLPRTIAPS